MLILGMLIWDVIFGSLTTLVAAAVTYVIGRIIKSRLQKAQTKKNKTVWGILGTILGSVPPIVGNMLVVPLLLLYAYGFTDPVVFMGHEFHAVYWFYVVTVGIGELISCTFLGLVVSFIMRNTKLDLKLPDGFGV